MRQNNEAPQPKVSVVIPIYKVEKYIEKCARSLFEQTLEDIEYIFVDDCSPDNSVAILLSVLEEYPNRREQVKVAHHEINKGLTSARNTGLEISTGEFIAHCDSDDWLLPNMYQDLYSKAIDINADVVLCDIRMIFHNYSEVFESVTIGDDNIQTLNTYILLPWTCTVNMIVRRSLYVENNIWSPSNISYCEDFHLTVRLLYFAKKIGKINEALYCYNRTNESSIVHTLNAKKIEDRSKCDLDIISFFRSKGVLDMYEQSLSLRMLSYMQYWVDKKELWSDVRGFYPRVQNYLLMAVNVSFWRKVMMWNICNNLYLIPNILFYLRKFKLKTLGIE